MQTRYIFFIVLAIYAFMACEDPIDVQLSPTNGQVNVDAWIDNRSQTQTIKLRRVSPFFDSSPSPVINGATVIVADESGNLFEFIEDGNTGNYIWEPNNGETIGEVGTTFGLSVEVEDQQYVSQSTMNRIMPIDSLITDFQEAELGMPEGIYGEVFARDFPGAGDAYWIQTYKNGEYLNKPSEINIAFDASFTPGGGVDGVNFILPIRQNINRVPDAMDDSDDDNTVAPWAVGDSIRVEIHSLNQETFLFLRQAQTQITLGDAGIFAEPPANVPTNIIPLNATEPSDEAVGFFNVAAVSEEGHIIE